MTGHFRKKTLFFRDTRDNREYDAKTRLSISITSFEKTLAEIVSVKIKLTLIKIVAYGFDHKFAKQVKYSPFLIKAN